MADISKLTGKALALLFGSAVAVGGVGFLVKNDEGKPVITSLLSSGSGTATSQGQKPAEPAAEPEKNAGEVASLPETKAEDPAATVQPDQPALPTFDLLRVEKDGSVVIAGKAMPDSTVEILLNGEAVAKGQSGATGEFAIVFDTPLPAGNHELLIRSTPKEGDSVVSAEAGIVTIPKAGDPAGEVLAMVQKEGEASRILQVPQSVETKPVEEPSKEVTALEQPKAGTPTNAEGEAALITEQAKAGAPANAEGEAALITEQAEAPEPEKPDVVIVPKSVMVQAVDVEADKLFIAGTGQADSLVRFYIDGTLKGTAKISPAGTFLFELDEGLTPGKHDLRVDQIGQADGQVISRAAVVVDHSPEPVAVAEAAPAIVPEKKAEQTAPAAAEPAVQSGQSATGEQVATQSKPLEAAEGKAAPAETVASAESQAPEAGKPVIETGRSVIIRRGDNLWKISRRMLGAGRKYTVIYSANDDQIKDPNRIYPGQVFEVPQEDEPVAGQDGKTSG